MTFAEALNEAKIECGADDGAFWICDGSAREPKSAGDWTFGQTNSGVRWELASGQLCIEGIDPHGKIEWATFTSDMVWI